MEAKAIASVDGVLAPALLIRMMRSGQWKLAKTRQKPKRVHHMAADQASNGLLFIIFFAVWRPEMMSEEKPSSFRLGGV